MNSRLTGLAVVVAVLAAAGCSSVVHTSALPSRPIVETQVLRVGNREVAGLRLLRTDGVPFGFVLRAEHGVVLCPHFNPTALGQGGTPAAMAQGWKANGLQGELSAKIEKVNDLAASKGVAVGMTVREAILKLSQ